MNGDPYNQVGESCKKQADSFNKIRESFKPEPPSSQAAQKPDWHKVRKIARLAGWNPAITIDPVQVAAATLEKAQAGRIKSLMVSIEWDDGSFAMDWCQMQRRMLLGHAFNVQTTVHDEVTKP